MYEQNEARLAVLHSIHTHTHIRCTELILYFSIDLFVDEGEYIASIRGEKERASSDDYCTERERAREARRGQSRRATPRGRETDEARWRMRRRGANVINYPSNDSD